MSVHKSEAEILDMLAKCEEDIKAIVAAAAETTNQISKMPVCNEKAMKSQGNKYMKNISRVQETLHELSYLLDCKAAAPTKSDSVQDKKRELESRLQMLENN
jgi:hypothetical protein